MSPPKVLLFGRAGVNFDSSAHALPERAFVAVLLLTFAPRNRLTRRQLALRLWEESTEVAALTSFRQLLRSIRKWELASGAKLLCVDRIDVWRDETCASTDVDLFHSLSNPETESELDNLVLLYSGGLLEGDATFGQELTLDIGRLRQKMWDRFCVLALAGAQKMPTAVQSENVLRQLLEANPYDERVWRALAITLLSIGRRNEVQDLYQRLRRQLAQDLQTVPELETESLFAGLLPTSAATAALNEPTRQILDTSRPKIPRLLILQPESAYWADETHRLLATSLMDDVTITLCRSRDFAVIAPFTARQILGASAFDAARRFEANYLVKPRLLPHGDALRLAYTLASLETGEILLADDIPFHAGQLGADHAIVATAIAGQISGRIQSFELDVYKSQGAASAYAAFLLGSEELNSLELANIRRARRHFAEAVNTSPGFAPAISMLARSLIWEWVILAQTDRDGIRRAQDLARRAVEIDPMDPRGHRELGRSYLYMGEIDDCVESMKFAHGRAPHYADVLADEADGLVHASKMEAARKLMDQAISLNPMPPDEYYWTSATALFFTGRYQQALAIIRQMRNLEPVARFAAACAAMAGDMTASLEFRAISMERFPDFRVEDWPKFVSLKNPLHVELYMNALRKAGFA